MIAAAILLTPLMLATSPMTITLAYQIKYSHETQSSQPLQAEGTEMAQIRTPTFSGTQTFDYMGKPRDADND